MTQFHYTPDSGGRPTHRHYTPSPRAQSSPRCKNCGIYDLDEDGRCERCDADPDGGAWAVR